MCKFFNHPSPFSEIKVSVLIVLLQKISIPLPWGAQWFELESPSPFSLSLKLSHFPFYILALASLFPLVFSSNPSIGVGMDIFWSHALCINFMHFGRKTVQMFYYVNMNCKKGLTNCFLLLAISTDFSFVFVLTDLILTDSIDILFYLRALQRKLNTAQRLSFCLHHRWNAPLAA